MKLKPLASSWRRIRRQRRRPAPKAGRAPAAAHVLARWPLIALPLALGGPAGAQQAEPDAAAAAGRIEISGARFRDQPGRTSLSGTELSRLPGTGGDPMKGIQSLPGVATLDDGSSEPAVRGARSSDNTYVVDFLPVGYLFHTGGFASVFNPSLIRRFSMASAAWGPEYGNAVGAVFDVQLRNPRTDRLGGQIDFGLLGANVLAEGPIGTDLSFLVAARRSWFDLVLKSTEDKEEGVLFTVPVYTDSQGRLLWNLDPRNRLRLDFSTAGDRLDFDVREGGKAAQRDPLLAGSSSQRQSYGTVAVVWETEPNDLISNRVALGQMRQSTTLRLGAAGSVAVDMDTSYLRQQLQLTAWRDHELTLGVDLESRQLQAELDFNYLRCTEFDPNCDISSAPRLVTAQRTRQNVSAAYASERWQFSPQWVATGGLRYSRDAYLDRTTVEPRLGLEYSPSSRWTWSAAVGLHSQRPTAEESLAVIGNPRLQPLRSRHAVLGVTQRLDEGWSWRLEAYAKTFENYAVADPVLNFRNGARGRAQGVELLVKKDPAPGRLSGFSGFASLSLSRSRRTVEATGENFPFDADQPVIATVAASYKHNDRWRYGLKWSYHTGSPYTPVVGTNGRFPDGRVRPLYGAVNAERLPAYHRLDLRVDAQFTPRFSAYAELINAYARRNVSGYSYSPDYSSRDEVLQLPLLPSVGIQWQF